MILKKLKILGLSCLISVVGYAQNFYVSPAGNDGNSGTSTGAAFKTLGRAQQKAREIIVSGLTQDVIINIMPGEYILNQPLEFTALDKVLQPAYYVNYQAYDVANKPIISGGVKVTGWSIHDTARNIWKVNIGNLYSRQVYINGARAIRARTQNGSGFLETSLGYLNTCGIDFASMPNLKDVEIVSNIHWRSSRIPIQSVCGKQIVIESKLWNGIHNQATFTKAPVEWVENALAFLDAEREWYIDKQAQMLYLKPDNNVTTQSAMNNLEIVVPKLQHLIQGADFSNTRFKDLVFCYSTWNKPSELNAETGTNYGFFTNQADDLLLYGRGSDEEQYRYVLPASLSFVRCDKIVFQNNVFKHIGSTGLAMGISSTNAIICNNQFMDISGSGVHVGDLTNVNNPCLSVNLNPDYYEEHCTADYSGLLVSNNQINNNYYNNVANEYLGCIPILVSFARNTTIKYNTITGFPYSGISVGWGWNYKIDNGVNEIAYNKIDCTSQTLADAGGIYTLSSLGTNTNRSSIHHNYILNQQVNMGAIYLDQGSSNVNVYDNLIDIQNTMVIPDSRNCIPIGSNGNIRGFVCYKDSENVSFERNLCNDRYNGVRPVCEGEYGCHNIIDAPNTRFTGFISSHPIISGSGQQSLYNCN